MLSIICKPLGIWFDSGGGLEAGSAMDRNLLTALGVIGLFMLMKRRFNWSRAINENIFLIILIGYMLISIFWSDIPFISFKRWTRELIAVIIAFLITTERSPNQSVETIFRRIIYICVPYSLMLIKYFPEYGRMYARWSGGVMWIGVTVHKNALGLLCVISVFFLIWTFVKRRQKHCTPVGKVHLLGEVLVLIIALWLLWAGGEGKTSATANAALAVGLVTFVVLLLLKKWRIQIRANIFLPIIAFCIIFGTTTVFVGGSNVGFFSSVLGRDSTLTGRTLTWAELVPVVMKQPIFGIGVGSFWTTSTREFYRMSHAHNGYLEILLELGFIGLFLFSMFLLSSCRKAHKVLAYDYYWGSLFVCFLIMLVLHNIAESSINNLTSTIMAVILFMSVSSKADTSFKRRVSKK